MFIHHVFFWLKKPESLDDRAQLVRGLESLRAIPGILQQHIGMPADTDRPVIDRSYSVSWLLVFKDADDEAVYQDHPIHHAFVDQNKHLWEKVTEYDSVSFEM